MRTATCVGLLLGAILVNPAMTRASVTVYNSASNWQAASGSYSTITFTELPVNTWITDQYSFLGVNFTDGSDQVDGNDSYTDLFGLHGALDSTTLEFDAPMSSIAIEFLGEAKILLYNDNMLIYTSPTFVGTGGLLFRGLVSTEPFDKVFLYDPFGGFFADNLYFGPPIPAPGALALFGAGALMIRSRRRQIT